MIFDEFGRMVALDCHLRRTFVILWLFVRWFCLAGLLNFERNIINVFLLWC